MKYRKGDVVAVKVILDHDMVPGETYSFRAQAKDIHCIIAAQYKAGDRATYMGEECEILHIDGGEAFVKWKNTGTRQVVSIACLERA
ncbi:hypothetical protein HMSP1_87 [Sinorhizobium phage HMSP1-Susan]|nr:hypothetical protein HMSP1_87 [Sinorhizobium phage HMSP1-Susan]